MEPIYKRYRAKGRKADTGINSALEIRSSSLRKRSIEIYKHALDGFAKWCEKNGYDLIKPSAFTKKDALLYLDYLKVEKSFTGKTCNNSIGYLKTLFFMLKEREIINDNPFCAVKKCKEEAGKNVAFTQKEVEMILPYMKTHNNVRLYYATQFVRYAFLRRTELQNLKVSFINLDTHTITIPAHISKNGKTDSITIPKSLEKIIIEMGLSSANPDHYVFGKELETCDRKLARVAYFSDFHRECIEAKNMRKELIFYGWKHTGCVELYNLVKDPYVVCRQCRHSDIKMKCDIYDH